MHLRSLAAGLALLAGATAFAPNAAAQTPIAAASAQDLADFEGRYAYRDGGELELVAYRGTLFAVIGEAKYPLRRQSADVFINGLNQAVPFRRDAAGAVTAFVEQGQAFPLLARAVRPESRALLEPRPADAPPWTYAPPRDLNDGLAVGPAGSFGVPQATVERLVAGVLGGAYPDVHSLLVWRSGRLVAEEYFHGYGPDRPHEMRSLTKALIAMVVGAAADRGLVQVDAPGALQPFLIAGGVPDPRKLRVSLAHLLSMRSGVACDDESEQAPVSNATYRQADWVAAFAAAPMTADPGGAGGPYCSFGVLAAGRAVELASRRPMAAFARETLFQPLGVPDAHWSWPFVLTSAGADDFAQIRMTPRAMMKLGVMMHGGGRGNGRAVLSEAWVRRMLSRQATVDGSGYGLGLRHRRYEVATPAGPRGVETLQLTGNGGQKIILVPSLDLIVVTTGGGYNENSPANAMMAQVLLPALLAQR